MAMPAADFGKLTQRLLANGRLEGGFRAIGRPVFLKSTYFKIADADGHRSEGLGWRVVPEVPELTASHRAALANRALSLPHADIGEVATFDHKTRVVDVRPPASDGTAATKRTRLKQAAADGTERLGFSGGNVNPPATNGPVRAQPTCVVVAATEGNEALTLRRRRLATVVRVGRAIHNATWIECKVGCRRVTPSYRSTFPSAPFRTGRAAFTASGSLVSL